MEVILISKSRGALGRLRFGWSTLFVAVLVAATLCILSAYGGFLLAAEHAAPVAAEAVPVSDLVWKRELAAQRRLIDEAREQASDNLSALARRLGTLQAHMSRLDTLGERLASMAQLSDGEFDFSSSPGAGGPGSLTDGDTSTSSVPDFIRALEKLTAQLEDRADQLTAMEHVLLGRKLQKSILPEGRPVREGYVASGYGRRADPITGKRDFHTGVDFGSRSGADVLAVAAGVVTGSGRRGDYGNMVEISHGNGFVTRYGHNSKNLVKVGDRVEKGQVIAVVGSTGRSTGPHVHFEVLQDGKIVDPMSYIGETIRTANK